MFHTFGDSHSWKGWCNINSPHIKIHRIGPLLCYSFGKEKLKRINISEKKYNVRNNDYVCFCLGEIDCRCHIHKHIEGNSYTAIIDDIVNSYFVAIRENEKLFVKLNICIFSVTPAIQKYNTVENRLYPYLGSDDDRKKYVQYFNQCIEKKCKEYNYIFFNVYNKYIDNNGFLSKNLSDNNVHINDEKYIVEFLKNLHYNL